MRQPDFRYIKTQMVRKKQWTLKWRRYPGAVGACDDASEKAKMMWICPDQSSEQLLATVIHENAHAALPDIDEDVIAHYEQATMRLLRRMGLVVAFRGK